MIKDPGRLPDLCISPAAQRGYRLQHTSFSPDDNLTSTLFVNVTLMALVSSVRLPFLPQRACLSVTSTYWLSPASRIPPERELTVIIHVWQPESALQVFISCFKGNWSVLRCAADDISALDSWRPRSPKVTHHECTNSNQKVIHSWITNEGVQLGSFELWATTEFPFRHLSLAVNVVMKFNKADPHRGHSWSFFHGHVLYSMVHVIVQVCKIWLLYHTDIN